MLARVIVLAGLIALVLAVILARRTESGSHPPARTIEVAGMSLTAPGGWAGRASTLDPRQRAPLVEAWNNRGIRVSVVELGNAPGSPRFPVVELPITFGSADLRGRGRAVKTFSTRGRSFAVDAEFPQRKLPPVLDEVNDVVSTLRIRRAPGGDAQTRARLSRPLHLPRARAGRCPRSRARRPAPGTSWALGPGPAFPVLGRRARPSLRDDIVRDGWHLHKTLWAIAPAYRGPLVVRGRRIDAPGAIRFGNRLLAYMHWAGAWPRTSGWRYVPSTTALRGPGCYAFQIDGVDFSRVIVFEARI